MTARHDEMMAFLNANLSMGFRVESLAGDASFRRYHRIYMNAGEGVYTTYLLMDAPPDKESVVEFVNVAEIMTSAVNVPDIIARDIERGFLLLQDFGAVEFAHLIRDDADNVNAYYTRALQTLADLQTLPTDVNLPAYSDEKLCAEMDLFTEWFLPYVGVSLTEDAKSMWQTFKDDLIEQIKLQPKVVVHRDYHSRNLMADKGSDALGVIDFQDAVIGAYSYDLVSLVRDAYIDFHETWANARIGEFHAIKALNINLDDFIRDVNIMSVQRHLKVLGIFIRLSERDGKHRYLEDIPKVMKDLNAELEWLQSHGEQSIEPFYAWLKAHVLPSYHANFN
ncbi:aminoglycoside phosphotransferase family protein [Moraxella ovis]|uniref:aminoglycoside phosphotransferase family protein n=1 Tax=Moraxella ovis TaxID=29433 RepID=UPI000E061966|nr:phosphotransferase [Moraxella ovis]STZ05327.1 Predicted phosphotransferase related to Ser/Thr protein kinases [Moraxella ovis]